VNYGGNPWNNNNNANHGGNPANNNGGNGFPLGAEPGQGWKERCPNGDKCISCIEKYHPRRDETKGCDLFHPKPGRARLHDKIRAACVSSPNATVKGVATVKLLVAAARGGRRGRHREKKKRKSSGSGTSTPTSSPPAKLAPAVALIVLTTAPAPRRMLQKTNLLAQQSFPGAK